MERGTIRKIFRYYFSNPEFGEEIKGAMEEFFNVKLPSDSKLKTKEEDEQKFNEWFIFDFHLSNGKTVLEDFYGRNPYDLSLTKLQVYKDLQNNLYGPFEILRVKRGEGLLLRNLQNKKRFFIQEYSATFQAQEGDVIFTRVAKIGDHYEAVGANPSPFPPMAKEQLKEILAKVEVKLNPKIIRDLEGEFSKMKRFNSKFDKKFKKKILDKGRCICDICGKEGKIGAFSFDRKTGEPLVICYDCNLEILAKEKGITKKEAERRRKKMFGVGYLFQEIKMKEYLALKDKRKLDSLKEINKVSKRILEVWNGLTIKERKGFEKMSNKKLREIYKNIPVDFSDL